MSSPFLFSVFCFLFSFPSFSFSSSPPIDFCASYTSSCTALLDQIGCPTQQRTIIACPIQQNKNDLSNFVGTCTCGGFNVGSVRVQEDLIDYSVKADVPSLLVYYPNSTQVDRCASYLSVCTSLMVTHLSCPFSQLSVSTCSSTDVSFSSPSFSLSCVCGTMSAASTRVQELVSDTLSKSAVATAISTYFPGAATHTTTGVTAMSFCQAYTYVCAQSLLTCPMQAQTNNCSADGTQSTFIGSCSCGQWNVGSGRYAENLVDSIIKSSVPTLRVLNTDSSSSFSLCASQQSICSSYLSLSGCPTPARQSSCVNLLNATSPSNSMMSATCTCGLNTVADTRLLELFIDSIVTPFMNATNLEASSPTVPLCPSSYPYRSTSSYSSSLCYTTPSFALAGSGPYSSWCASPLVPVYATSSISLALQSSQLVQTFLQQGAGAICGGAQNPTACPPSYPYLCPSLSTCFNDATFASSCNGAINSWCALPNAPPLLQTFITQGYGINCTNAQAVSCPPSYPFLCPSTSVCYNDAKSATSCNGPVNSWCAMLNSPLQIQQFVTQGYGIYCSQAQASLCPSSFPFFSGSCFNPSTSPFSSSSSLCYNAANYANVCNGPVGSWCVLKGFPVDSVITNFVNQGLAAYCA